MPKQKLIIILGLVLSLITAFLVKAWMDQKADELEEQAKLQVAQQKERHLSVLMAKTAIPAGTLVTPEHVEQKSFPEKQVPLDAVVSFDRIEGRVARTDILQGEPLSINKLEYPRGAAGLAAVTPVGRRAIAISVDSIATVAGMVKPGDYVDVIVLIAVPMQLADGSKMNDNRVIPLFQNVEVLAVGQNTVGATRSAAGSRYASEKPEEAAASSRQAPLVTLSLTPKEASILAYISEQGKIRLVLRNPQDSKMEPLEITSMESLFRYLSPQQPPAPEAPEPSGYVEVYRGLAKDRVPIHD